MSASPPTRRIMISLRRLILRLFLTQLFLLSNACHAITMEQQRDDNFLICIESMFQADKDKDSHLTLQEYQTFAKYYASQLGSADGDVSDQLFDLYDPLVSKSGGTTEDGMNVYGCDPEDTYKIANTEREQELEMVCQILQGCICCGVCMAG